MIFTIPLTLINVFPELVMLPALYLYAMVGFLRYIRSLPPLLLPLASRSAFGTAIMAFYARLPLVLAPSLSVSVFFTYTVCLSMDIPIIRPLRRLSIRRDLHCFYNVRLA
jgi:hypothetical protein